MTVLLKFPNFKIEIEDNVANKLLAHLPNICSEKDSNIINFQKDHDKKAIKIIINLLSKNLLNEKNILFCLADLDFLSANNLVDELDYFCLINMDKISDWILLYPIFYDCKHILETFGRFEIKTNNETIIYLGSVGQEHCFLNIENINEIITIKFDINRIHNDRIVSNRKSFIKYTGYIIEEPRVMISFSQKDPIIVLYFDYKVYHIDSDYTFTLLDNEKPIIIDGEEFPKTFLNDKKNIYETDNLILTRKTNGLDIYLGSFLLKSLMTTQIENENTILYLIKNDQGFILVIGNDNNKIIRIFSISK